MNLFSKRCACGGNIFGPRVGGKAKGEWLGRDTCRTCERKATPAAGNIEQEQDR